jgi:hypothetical protein
LSDFKPILAVASALVLLVTFVAPVLAVEYNPGVSVGQYVKYGNFFEVNLQSKAGIDVFYDWEKVEVTAVSGKEVTLLSTGQFKNGTALPNLGVTTHNLETGETDETHSLLKSIIPANLNEGDAVPPGTMSVNQTEIRTYLGVSRVVNILVKETSTNSSSTNRLTVTYDKVSGLALEYEQWWTDPATGQQRAIDYSVTDTNVFEVAHPSTAIPMVAIYALGATVVVVALPVSAVVVHRRQKTETKHKALEKKVMDLTYNLSGVNRGECYLADSLERCLKIVSDINKRGVNCLCVVREDPELVSKNYSLKTEDIVLLSLHPVKGFKAISSLQEISIATAKFLKAGGGVVLLDGFEYLVSRFGFNTVYMCLQEKHIDFLEAGAVLLVPVNMETLDPRERGQLLSELKLL